MSMGTFEYDLMLRLLVKGGYTLLIDADEKTAKFPEEDVWEIKFEQGGTESLERGYLDSVDAYYDGLPVVGGSLDCLAYKLNGKVIWKPGKTVSPALLPLKHYASRILIKMTPFGAAIILLSKSSLSLPERELMAQVCDDFRRAILSDCGGKGSVKYVITLSTIIVGSFDDKQRRWAKANSNRVSVSGNFFRYLCVEPESERIWTPTKLQTIADRRIIKQVFSSTGNSVESLFINDKSKVFSWWRVVFSGCLAFILTTVGVIYSSPLLSVLVHAFVPFVVFASFFATMKNQVKVRRQINFGVSIHVALTVVFFMWFLFPSDFGGWLSIMRVVFVTAAPSLLLGIGMQVTSNVFQGCDRNDLT